MNTQLQCYNHLQRLTTVTSNEQGFFLRKDFWYFKSSDIMSTAYNEHIITNEIVRCKRDPVYLLHLPIRLDVISLPL